MIAKLRPLLVPAICTLVMGALLIGLGIWQLHRLTWKEAIIARIEARTKAPLQPLPPLSDWAKLKPDDYDYRRVSLDGTFRKDASVLVFRPSAEGPGYLVMTPLDLSGGGSVVVNRGFVPADFKGEAEHFAAHSTGDAHVTGLMRPPEARNLFTPADEPAKDIFFTRDPRLIAAHLGLDNAAPFIVDADATPQAAGVKNAAWPHGGTTALAIPNNHLSYALTWFGLALGLFGVFATFAWGRLAQSSDPFAAETKGEDARRSADSAPPFRATSTR